MNLPTTDVVNHESSFEVRQQFQLACGSNQPGECIELEIRNSAQGDWEPFQFNSDLPYVLIGRDDACDVQLRHDRVTSRHAYLQLIGGRLACVDLSGGKGIRFLREGRRRVVGWLDEQEEVEVGPYAIRRTGTIQPTATAAGIDIDRIFSQANDNRFGEISLRFVAGAKPATPLKISRPVTIIGKGHSCKLKLTDDTVSSAQCSLLLSQDGAWVVNLRSSKTTTLNGEGLEFGRLTEGSELEVGRFKLVVQSQDNGDATAGHSIAPHQVPSNGHGSGLSEQFVLSLMDQFSSMQQTMFSQMQQQAVMLAQMFGSLQPNVQQKIQNDIDQIQKVNGQIQELRSQPSEAEAVHDPHAVDESTIVSHDDDDDGVPRTEHQVEEKLERLESEQAENWQSVMQSLDAQPQNADRAAED